MCTFKGWNIEIKSKTDLIVVNDKNEAYFVIFDEERDPLLWIRPSKYGEGVTFDKMGWGISVDVLYEQQQIIITYTDPSLDDEEDEDEEE